MNNWNMGHMNYVPDHKRCISSTGYNDLIYPNVNGISYQNSVPLYANKNIPFYSSYVDLNRDCENSIGSRRQFSWRSPMQRSQTMVQPTRPQDPYAQRPFENAFKAAINRMKESSVYRLGDVQKGSQNSKFELFDADDMYRRNCSTLQPRKMVPDSRVSSANHKIFRCNSTADRSKDDNSSVHTLSFDNTSETESDRNYKDNKYLSEDTMSNKSTSTYGQSVFVDGPVASSGLSIVIPAHIIPKPKESSPIVTETFISPKTVEKPKSCIPSRDHTNIENDEDSELEPLRSVQEIIAKVEALTSESHKVMSKSLTLNQDKTVAKKPQKNSSQKGLDGYPITQHAGQLSTQGKRLSGFYKKNHPAPLKGKSINSAPFDFQKLHSAFLEQKQEIQNLKVILDQKTDYIAQLESDIRSYEPWR